MIDIKDILKLSDGKEYGVANKITYDNKTYYYLVDINDNSNIKFCYEERLENQIDLIEEKDKEIIKKLIISFAKNITI